MRITVNPPPPLAPMFDITGTSFTFAASVFVPIPLRRRGVVIGRGGRSVQTGGKLQNKTRGDRGGIEAAARCPSPVAICGTALCSSCSDDKRGGGRTIPRCCCCFAVSKVVYRAIHKLCG